MMQGDQTSPKKTTHSLQEDAAVTADTTKNTADAAAGEVTAPGVELATAPPEYKRYAKLLGMGVSKETVFAKMTANSPELDPAVLGVAPATASAGDGAAGANTAASDTCTVAVDVSSPPEPSADEAGGMRIAAGTDVGMSSGPANTAFVFIKPHAVTDAVKNLVSSTLEGKGFTIVTQGELKSEVIDEKKLIDQHYYAIASKATILTPDQLNVPTDKFEAQFGLGWADALATGRVMNAMDGCKALGLDADGLDAEWAKAKKAKKLVKFGGGFYCGLIEIEGNEPHWIFNGFFMSMRSKFTVPGECIYWYVVEWDSGATPWSDFRGKVLGPTDPADAPADSLRGLILKDWEALGLKHVPNVGDNGVHASASPFEALAERNNWLSASFADDPFGGPLLKCGVSEATIKAWSVDPQLVIDGSNASLFDSVEDMDTGTCLEKLISINAENQ